MKSAIYPGSFDPVTNGHLDIITRAAPLFDQLVVGVFHSPPKSLLFSLDERLALMRRAVATLPNVRVESYTGLTATYAQELGAQVIVRGLRAMSDFDMEFQLALMNKKLVSGLETVCLVASTEYSYLSSSIVKEIVALGGTVTGLVPPHVEVALNQALHPTDGPAPKRTSKWTM
ncbi:MAG: pantetheine-phosphate adenylyltransferase [Chloroflexota bacterium]|nr:MAG: pantetheine-phosphate adenylyltransferase [Chloroflexota bacterium]